MPFLVTRAGDEVKISLEPDADGTFGWIDALHHDLDGALRAFRYLGQKAAANYPPGDPKAQKVLESVDKHLRTLEGLKTAIIDPVFPLER